MADLGLHGAVFEVEIAKDLPLYHLIRRTVEQGEELPPVVTAGRLERLVELVRPELMLCQVGGYDNRESTNGQVYGIWVLHPSLPRNPPGAHIEGTPLVPKGVSAEKILVSLLLAGLQRVRASIPNVHVGPPTILGLMSADGFKIEINANVVCGPDDPGSWSSRGRWFHAKKFVALFDSVWLLDANDSIDRMLIQMIQAGLAVVRAEQMPSPSSVATGLDRPDPAVSFTVSYFENGTIAISAEDAAKLRRWQTEQGLLVNVSMRRIADSNLSTEYVEKFRKVVSREMLELQEELALLEFEQAAHCIRHETYLKEPTATDVVQQLLECCLNPSDLALAELKSRIKKLPDDDDDDDDDDID